MEIPMNFISLKSSNTKTYFPFEILEAGSNNTVSVTDFQVNIKAIHINDKPFLLRPGAMSHPGMSFNNGSGSWAIIRKTTPSVLS